MSITPIVTVEKIRAAKYEEREGQSLWTFHGPAKSTDVFNAPQVTLLPIFVVF
jgi:hypothetical protein